MYKRMKRNKLGRKKSHREALIRNLLRSLFEHNYVVTTTSKAKVLKQEATSLVQKGLGKKDDLVFARKLKVILGKDSLVKKYWEYLEKDDVGIGFVRVGYRDGDKSEMSRVFLLGLDKKKAPSKKSKKEEEKEKDEKREKKGPDTTPPIKETKPRVEDSVKNVEKPKVTRKPRRAKARAGL